MVDKRKVKFFSSKSPSRPDRDFNVNKNVSWQKDSNMHYQVPPKPITSFGVSRCGKHSCPDDYYTMMINDPNLDPNLDVGVEELLGKNNNVTKGKIKNQNKLKIQGYIDKHVESKLPLKSKSFIADENAKSNPVGNTNLCYTKYAMVEGKLKQIEVCVKVKDADQKHTKLAEHIDPERATATLQRHYSPRRVDMSTSKFLPHYQYLEPYQYRYQTARNRWEDCKLFPCEPEVNCHPEELNKPCVAVNMKTPPTNVKKERITKPDPERHFRTWKEREERRQRHEERHQKHEENLNKKKGKGGYQFKVAYGINNEKDDRHFKENEPKYNECCEPKLCCPQPGKKLFITPLSGLPEENDLRRKTGRNIIKESKDYTTKYTVYDQEGGQSSNCAPKCDYDKGGKSCNFTPTCYSLGSRPSYNCSSSKHYSSCLPCNLTSSNNAIFEESSCSQVHKDKDCHYCVCHRSRPTEMVDTINWREGVCFNNKIDSILKRYQIHNPRYM